MFLNKNITCAEEMQVCVDYLRELLHLHHWTVDVGWDINTESDSSMLEVFIPYGRYYAIIRVSDAFKDDNFKCQLNSIIHELLHLITNNIIDVCISAVEPVNRRLAGQLNNIITLPIELVTDFLTSVIVDNVQLPKTPKELAIELNIKIK